VRRQALAGLFALALSGPPAVAFAQDPAPATPTPTPPPDSTAPPAAFPAPGAAAPAAGASAGTSKEDEYKQRGKALDDALDALLAIPETPAAFALGVSPETVAHPGTPRDAVAQVVAYVAPGGSVKPGLATEVAPFRPLFAKYTVDQWKAKQDVSWYEYLLDGFRLSLATAADPTAPASSAPTLIAAGARLSIVDQRDYRRNDAYVAAVRDALTKCFPDQVTPGQGGTSFQAVQIAGDCRLDLDKALEQAKKLLTSGFRLEVAAAIVTAQTQPPFQADWRSTQIWAAADYAFSIGTVGLAGAADWHDDVLNERVSSQSLGARINLGTSRGSWTASALYGRFGQTTTDKHSDIKYGTTLDGKIASYVVLRAGLQGIRDLDAHTNSLLFLVSLATANGDPVFSRVFGAQP